MNLESRICPTCCKQYKTLPTSEQKYCSRRCYEFRGGKQNNFSEKELGFYRRFGLVTPSSKFPRHQVREK